MSYKQVLFRAEAREKVLRGASALADAVRVTLGPKSKCVLIAKKWGTPIVCNDGVTIAKEFELKDPVEQLGAQMMRQAAEKTSDAVGDGTTTATLLAHSIFADGVRNVTAGASAVDLKRGLDRGMRVALDAIRAISRRIESKVEKAQVASISAHNDAAMGALVADAMDKVGSEGAITVEESRSTETTLEVVEGMQFEHGYLSPYFVSDPEKREVVFENAFLLFTDQKVTRLAELLPLLEQIAKEGRPLVVVAEEVEGEALATLVVNKLRGVLQCAAVKAPGFGERRKAGLQDLAILTGGKVVSEELGIKFDKIVLADLGRAKRVVIDKDTTTIVGGRGRPLRLLPVAMNCGVAFRKPLPVTTRKSFRSVWQSLRAGSRSFGWAHPRSWSCKTKRRLLTTPSARPRQPWPKALCPAEGWRFCGRWTLWVRRPQSARVTNARACSFSSVPSKRPHGKSPKTPQRIPVWWWCGCAKVLEIMDSTQPGGSMWTW